jgi:hypothetical protein
MCGHGNLQAWSPGATWTALRVPSCLAPFRAHGVSLITGIWAEVMLKINNGNDGVICMRRTLGSGDLWSCHVIQLGIARNTG